MHSPGTNLIKYFPITQTHQPRQHKISTAVPRQLSKPAAVCLEYVCAKRFVVLFLNLQHIFSVHTIIFCAAFLNLNLNFLNLLFWTPAPFTSTHCRAESVLFSPINLDSLRYEQKDNPKSLRWPKIMNLHLYHYGRSELTSGKYCFSSVSIPLIYLGYYELSSNTLATDLDCWSSWKNKQFLHQVYKVSFRISVECFTLRTSPTPQSGSVAWFILWNPKPRVEILFL